MRHIFVVNPHSGPQDATKSIQEELASQSEKCEVYVTKGPGDAIEYVRAQCEKDHSPLRFYACGGDGTLNEVVNGAAGFSHAAVGCYPCGSGNDFVKYYGGKEIFSDIGALIAGGETPVDIFRVNGRYAVNVVNFGFEGKAGARMISFRRFPLMKGHRAYYGAIAATLVDGMKTACRIQADGKDFFDGNILLGSMANGDYVGGSFRCGPRADTADGLMELCLVKPISRLRLVKLLGIYQRGEHLDSPELKNHIQYTRAQKVEIDTQKEIQMCLDGEIIPGKHFNIEIIPGGIRFILPGAAKHHPDGLHLNEKKK